jgi:hypothetical protein
MVECEHAYAHLLLCECARAGACVRGLCASVRSSSKVHANAIVLASERVYAGLSGCPCVHVECAHSQ